MKQEASEFKRQSLYHHDHHHHQTKRSGSRFKSQWRSKRSYSRTARRSIKADVRSEETSPVQPQAAVVNESVLSPEQSLFLTQFAQEFAAEFSKRFFEHMNAQICQVLGLDKLPIKNID
jgi:hypothetical protein